MLRLARIASGLLFALGLYILAAAVMAALLGCNDVPHVQAQCVIDAEQREAAAAFVIGCAAAANPLSDEEGEDLVAQCEASAARLFCRHRVRFWDGHAGWVDCALADSTELQSRCEAVRRAYETTQ